MSDSPNGDIPPLAEAGGLALVREGVMVSRQEMERRVTERTIELATLALEDGLKYRSFKVCARCGVTMPGLPKAMFVRMAFELAKLVGPQVMNVALVITKELGSTMERAKTALAVYDRVEGLDEDAVAHLEEEHLQAWGRKRGKRMIWVDL
jgi:hypothetical protein